jgi:hypothetical protein
MADIENTTPDERMQYFLDAAAEVSRRRDASSARESR